MISVGTKPPSSKQPEHTVVEAVTRSTMHLAFHMAVQGAVKARLHIPHTSTHRGQSCCSGLPMEGMAHVRRLEEGQSSEDVQLPCLV